MGEVGKASVGEGRITFFFYPLFAVNQKALLGESVAEEEEEEEVAAVVGKET